MFYWYSCTHLLRLLRDYFRRLRSLVFIDYFFGGGGAIDLILFKSIPYEKLHFASLLYSFVTWGEHKVFLSCVIHRLCSLSFASSHVVWGRQLTIYCSGTDLCQNLCFHSSGESGISAAKCSALCRHVTVSSLTWWIVDAQLYPPQLAAVSWGYWDDSG